MLILFVAFIIGAVVISSYTRYEAEIFHWFEENMEWLDDNPGIVLVSGLVLVAPLLMLSGYLPMVYLAAYVLFWLAIFLVFGFHRQLGMLFQAPFYMLLILQVIRSHPFTGICIIAGLAAMIIFTWPRFPNQVIPDFLNSVMGVFQKLTKH